MKKLDVILVHILKQDWPHRWPSFIPDLVAASKTNEALCENSMAILALLSEEVFDFSRGELTQAKTRELKGTLNNEFRLIHDLCTCVSLAVVFLVVVFGGQGGGVFPFRFWGWLCVVRESAVSAAARA